MGGSSKRMKSFAGVIAKAINHPQTEPDHLEIDRSDRFSFYKIGPVISVSVRENVPIIITYIITFSSPFPLILSLFIAWYGCAISYYIATRDP